MTTEQKQWLDDHRGEGFRVVGRAPGGCRWVRVGMLHADGSFDLKQGDAPPEVRIGSFEVGVLELMTHQAMRGL